VLAINIIFLFVENKNLNKNKKELISYREGMGVGSKVEMCKSISFCQNFLDFVEKSCQTIGSRKSWFLLRTSVLGVI